MRELKALQSQCDEIEKIAQDIIIEAQGSGMDNIIELASGLSEEVTDFSRKVDDVKNKILGE